VKTDADAHDIEQAGTMALPYAGYGNQRLCPIRGADARKLTMSPPPQGLARAHPRATAQRADVQFRDRPLPNAAGLSPEFVDGLSRVPYAALRR
jgi:hypothetical protein